MTDDKALRRSNERAEEAAARMRYEKVWDRDARMAWKVTLDSQASEPTPGRLLIDDRLDDVHVCGWCDQRGHISDDCPEPWVPSRRSVEAPGPKVQMPHNKTSEGTAPDIGDREHPGHPTGRAAGSGRDPAGAGHESARSPSEEASGPPINPDKFDTSGEEDRASLTEPSVGPDGSPAETRRFQGSAPSQPTRQTSGPQTGAQAKPATSPELAPDSHREAVDSGGAFERQWAIGPDGFIASDARGIVVVPLADAERARDQWREECWDILLEMGRFSDDPRPVTEREANPGEALAAVKELDTEWREAMKELWECYVESGADPDGADVRHLNPGEALRAVKELRADLDDEYKCGNHWRDRFQETWEKLAEERAKREGAEAELARAQRRLDHDTDWQLRAKRLEAAIRKHWGARSHIGGPGHRKEDQELYAALKEEEKNGS